jgi:hypothetical protein
MHLTWTDLAKVPEALGKHCVRIMENILAKFSVRVEMFYG